MDIRRLVSSLSAVVLIAAFAVVVPAGPAGAAPLVLSGRNTDLGSGWKFVLVNPNAAIDPDGRYENAPDPGYDDSRWRTVNVPHDWSIELTPTAAAGAGTNAVTGFLQGGLGWYRRTFTLPSSASGKRIGIEFDGVSMDSQVYVNGSLLGGHPYGYTGFAFDLTGKLSKYGVGSPM